MTHDASDALFYLRPMRARVRAQGDTTLICKMTVIGVMRHRE
jgi:hypothetical protein